MKIQYLPVNWTTYHELVQKLAATILSDCEKPDKIVGISRGGLTLGHILSDFLQIPVATFTIQSYTDIQKQGEVKITEPLKLSIIGKHILLADDVSDSGKTLKRAISYLNHFKPKKITTATIFFKPHSIFRPNFFAEQTTNWILFPYNPTERILTITKTMEKKGESKADIQKHLISLHYTTDQIKFVRKYYLP